MGANLSSWSTAWPSGSSSIRLGDDEIRNSKSLLELAVNDEHYFTVASASSLSGGIHKQGSARIFGIATRASLATPSSTDSNTRLAYAADMQSLHFIGTSSNSTMVWGADPPGAQAYSASTTLASGATTVVILTSEVFDVGGYYTAGGSRLTIPSGFSGRHLILGSARFPSLHTGTRRALAIVDPGSGNVYEMASVGTNNSAGDIAINVQFLVRPAEGASFQLAAFQDTGGNLSLGSVFFTIQKI